MYLEVRIKTLSQEKKENKTVMATEQEARNLAESSRETNWTNPSFLKEIFLGNLRLDLIHPFPKSKGVDRPEFKEYFEKFRNFLRDEVDSDKIDREGKIPSELLEKLAKMGAFGFKISKEYGGLEFSQAEYNHLMQLIGSKDGNLVALLSAHQSIGVPQPLKLFGTKEQKEKYLPRIAKGEVTAFALTEPHVGSDPANLSTEVVESEDGSHYILNGTKLWCTNGTIATLLVVMARHPEDNRLSAFIVETKWEGVSIDHRCHFMGLKAIENAVITFKNVKVPKEDLIWKRGAGLKLALITLNTGRLALPATTTGNAKTCLEITRRWSQDRIQWGKPVGKHEAISQKIADMAATTFAMESVMELSTAMADQGYDIRLESSVGKMYNTEAGWKIVDETLQIRGGRGYETSDSLAARGEVRVPVERMMRDYRINLIFEGSSEVMRLFMAREAVDKHLSVAGVIIDPKASIFQKMMALPKIGLFYAWWYPTRWLGFSCWPRYSEFGPLASHMRFIDRSTRKLSREIFHGMMVYQAGMERKQAFLFRVVEIGSELFTMAATISNATKLKAEGNKKAQTLADLFCSNARRHVKAKFKSLWANEDKLKYKVAKEILEDEHTWLEKGIVGLQMPEGQDKLI